MEAWPALLLVLAFGLLTLLFGYALFRFLVVLAGAGLGLAYGPVLYTMVAGPPGPGVALLAALAGALQFALLAFFAFWGMVFFWGGAFGFVLAAAFFGHAVLPALVVGVVFGILAVVFERFLIVAFTAWSGAWAIVTVLAVWLGVVTQLPGPVLDPWWIASGTPAWPILVITLVLAVLGAAFQFRAMRPEERGLWRRST
ncbi:MAG TPA: hypothetical protein VF171_08220 [Trueperaceae bacterium]